METSIGAGLLRTKSWKLVGRGSPAREEMSWQRCHSIGQLFFQCSPIQANLILLTHTRSLSLDIHFTSPSRVEYLLVASSFKTICFILPSKALAARGAVARLSLIQTARYWLWPHINAGRNVSVTEFNTSASLSCPSSNQFSDVDSSSIRKNGRGSSTHDPSAANCFVECLSYQPCP